MKNYLFSFLLLIFFTQNLSSQLPACSVSGIPDLTYFDLSTEGTHPDFELNYILI